MDVGVAIIDRFTFFALEFFETVERGSTATMADFLAFMGCAALSWSRGPACGPDSLTCPWPSTETLPGLKCLCLAKLVPSWCSKAA
jgi:hypothetical protein